MSEVPERLKLARSWFENQMFTLTDRARKILDAYIGPDQLSKIADVEAAALIAASVAYAEVWNQSGLLAEEANWRKRAEDPVATVKVHVLKRGVALCNYLRPGQWPVEDRWVGFDDTELLESVTCSKCRDALGRQF